MPVKRTSKAIEALEEHIGKGHDPDHATDLAPTLALISVAESLDALVEIGADAIGRLTQIARFLQERR